MGVQWMVSDLPALEPCNISIVARNESSSSCSLANVSGGSINFVQTGSPDLPISLCRLSR